MPLGLNNLLLYNESRRTKHMLGAEPTMNKKSWSSSCRYNGKDVYLGVHDTEFDAHLAYKKCKLNIIKEAANSQKDERVKHGLMLHYAILLKT